MRADLRVSPQVRAGGSNVDPDADVADGGEQAGQCEPDAVEQDLGWLGVLGSYEVALAQPAVVAEGSHFEGALKEKLLG